MSASQRRGAARSGFTIIELMVSIGIISVLLSFALPALMGARGRAGEVRSLANARGVAADMRAFARQFGTWPFRAPGERPPGYPGTPPAGALTVRLWPDGWMSVGDHWQHSRLWPGIVAAVAPWEEHYETWVSPGREHSSLYADDGLPSAFIMTSYLYSNSFIASPALWTEGATADESLIAPTRPTDVGFPSNKVLVWDGDLAYLPRPPRRVEGHWLHATPMAFADGHAAVLNPLDATPGVANPLNNDSATRLHNTPGGVLGRDY